MSPQKRDGKDRPFSSLETFSDDPKTPDISARLADEEEAREVLDDSDIKEVLKMDIEIARLLEDYILSEGVEGDIRKVPDLAVWEEPKPAFQPKKLDALRRMAKLRSDSMLEGPIRTRERAARFLGRLIDHVDTRTNLDSGRVRNSQEHIDRTLTLITKIAELKSHLVNTENWVSTSLTIDTEGAVTCSPENVQVLRDILNKTIEALNYVRPGEHVGEIKDCDELRNMQYMEADERTWHYSMRLGGVSPRTPLRGQLEVEQAFEILNAHLKTLTEKSSLSVRMDSRESAAGFGEVAAALRVIAEEMSAAQVVEKPLKDEVKQGWEDAVSKTIFVIAHTLDRTKFIHGANADDFLNLVDSERLSQEAKRMKDEEQVIQAEIEEKRNPVEKTFMEKVSQAWGEATGKKQKKPLVSMARLTFQQEELRKRIKLVTGILMKRREIQG